MNKEQKCLPLESWSEFSFFLNQFVCRMIRCEFGRSTAGKLKLETIDCWFYFMNTMQETRPPRTHNDWLGNHRSVNENDTKRWLNLRKGNPLRRFSPISNEMIRVLFTFSNRFYTFSLSKTYVIDSCIENETERERRLFSVRNFCIHSSNVTRKKNRTKSSYFDFRWRSTTKSIPRRYSM